MVVIIGTENEDKIESARRALNKYYDNVEIIGVYVDSMVPEQPLNEEVLQGAQNRLNNLKQYCIDNQMKYDLLLSIESGIVKQFDVWEEISIAIIENNDGIVSRSTSAGFPIEEEVVYKIRESGEKAVLEEIFGDVHNQKGIQFLTNNKINRIDIMEQAFLLALIKIINNGKW